MLKLLILKSLEFNSFCEVLINNREYINFHDRRVFEVYETFIIKKVFEIKFHQFVSGGFLIYCSPISVE